ncbi:MAG TPA: chaperonin GroEL [Blastocatellia bacterium]|nr:chaperonin GroEL [Blastocatellia bacterium]
MVYRPFVDEKLCFVLMPFQDFFDGCYEKIIKPAAVDAGLEAMRADDVYGIGVIIQDIWGLIWKARIVVADVTDKNPNVNYELGLCHALGIPTILITRREEDVPFDYRHRRFILYDTEEVDWVQKLHDDLKKTIEAVLTGSESFTDLQWPYETRAIGEPATISSLLAVENPRDIVIEGTLEVKRVIGKAIGPAGLGRSTSVGGREPITYKEGFNILRGLKSANPLQDRGINEMRRVARDILNYAGDGSKTAILLAQAMLENGNETLKRGYLARDVIHGMKTAVDMIVGELQTSAKQVTAVELTQVASTAAQNNDFGRLICEAMEKVGSDGLISSDESRTNETFLEVTEGMEFDRGYLSPYFITDAESNAAVLENPLVLITDKRINSFREMLPLLEQVAAQGKTFLIIAGDVEGEALATLVVNKMRGTLNAVAVKAPGTGDRQRAMLEDIAILTGGKFVSEHLGVRLESIQTSDLGTASRVVVDSEKTTIVEGGGELSAIEARVKSLRARIDDAHSDFEREKVVDRLTKLVGGVATIRIGGMTEVELIDNRYRIQSAMHSSKSAIEEGWLPGGGISLHLASKSVRDSITEEGPEAAGMHVVAEALEVPLVALIGTAGVSSTQVLVKMDDSNQSTTGFNVATKEVEDLVEAGILDSARMLRGALEIAFSHTKAMLETSEWDLTPPDSPVASEIL